MPGSSPGMTNVFVLTSCSDTASRSRRMCCARFGLLVPPSPIRGRRECRAPDAPAAARAGVVVVSTRVSQVTPESPGIPRAMVYGLYRALPGDRLSCHRRYADRSANLTPASGRQDHTSSPSAHQCARQARRRVHRIPPRARDVASRPSEWDGTARDIQLIWVFGKPEYFFKKGLDSARLHQI